MQRKSVSLGSISTRIDYGLTASAIERDTGNKFLRITDIREGRIDWENVPYCQCSQQDEKKYGLQKGDIVFARTGSVGNSCLVPEVPRGAVFASYLIRIRPNGEIVDPVYLSYFFHTPDYWRQIMGAAVGAIHLGLNATKLKQLRIPLHPLPEQKRIAVILAKADRLRCLRRYARELSDTYLQSVFLEMFGDPESGFEVVHIQDIASRKKHALSSGPFGSNLTSKHYTDDGVVVLRGLNISTGELDLHDVKYISEEKAQSLARSEVRPGDVVIVAVGASGLACQIPETLPRAIMSQNFNKITPDVSKITPTYLEYCINSPIVQHQFSREITDTVRTFLSLTKLKTVEIPLPPFQLQQEFAHTVRKFERLSAQQREAERQTEHLFQTLLHRAFRGEL
jgi:type I restriction enzyme S subunit